jgi:anti-sigma factor RsiW
MKNFEKNHIHAYLKGHLSPETARIFEAEVRQNPVLAKEVEIRRFEQEAMDLLIATDLKNKMKLWNEQINLIKKIQSSES